MDLDEVSAFPSVTKTDPNSMRRFLKYGCLDFDDLEQCAFVRALTSFSKCFPTDLHLNNQKPICGMIAGKVRKSGNQSYELLKSR